MSGPILLIGIGATKAGTSWLYRTLADREDCALPAVKELHYWDTFSPPIRAKQLDAFRAQLRRFETTREEAEAAGRGWQVRNMERRIADMAGLIAMLDAPRKGHGAYLEYVLNRAGEARLAADICPAYGLLSKAKLKDMAALRADVRLLYLVRDPLARLWSAVRMQAERQLMEGQTVPKKSNATLWRILHKGHETHLTERGDYAATIARLDAALPPERFRVMVMEELMSDAGYGALCAWLSLPPAPAPLERKVHPGQEVVMRDDLRQPALDFLAPQYEAVAAHLGRVPEAWATNMEAL
ncbi:MAG: sulfotransferase family protein [Pseudomonadota bacterium]